MSQQQAPSFAFGSSHRLLLLSDIMSRLTSAAVETDQMLGSRALYEAQPAARSTAVNQPCRADIRCSSETRASSSAGQTSALLCEPSCFYAWTAGRTAGSRMICFGCHSAQRDCEPDGFSCSLIAKCFLFVLRSRDEPVGRFSSQSGHVHP